MNPFQTIIEISGIGLQPEKMRLDKKKSEKNQKTIGKNEVFMNFQCIYQKIELNID